MMFKEAEQLAENIFPQVAFIQSLFGFAFILHL